MIARYDAWKIATGERIGIDDWLLHVHSGMAIFLITAIVLRRSLGSVIPISAVILAACLNELFDRINYADWRWEDTSRDLLFTLAWPLLIFLFTRSGIIRRHDRASR